MRAVFQSSRPHCFITADRMWGSLRDGKWTGMIRDLVEDRADIAVANMDHTYARNQAADFPHGLRTGRHSPYQEEKPLSEVIWLIVTAFCNAGEAVSRESTSSRFLLLALYLTTMILHAYYSSFLISSLTVDMNYLPFTDLRTMYEARTHSFGIVGGTGMEDEFKLSPVLLYRSIWDEIVLADPRNLSPSIEDLIKRLCIDQHAVTIGRTYLVSRPLPCKVISLPGYYFASQRSMPVQKDSPLMGVFQFQMRKIVEAGIIDRLERKWMPKLADSPDVDRSPITLLQASTAFYFLLLGHLAALLALIIEIKFAKWRR
ncbi:glutamate receptor 3-like [Macrobrachium rosenbergii]|uniref:glutamate receptor 3-like n=1 Tax=Macrobrachium rosenbergii TaxID=79674 RepID=UPI0034D4EFF5